ncbi:hypothetical protein LX32DRAFT_335021 [Colletotrichum zoysiae]|uniref:Uncharacterized protein n=1 Tax=Colletotrichum zoysiae TaxID=1216348 RepID=A0AAD9H326_9PEZI|nr:hypothetical protein LX32DRAFT_335021 [Colletotrichum zoysiae]
MIGTLLPLVFFVDTENQKYLVFLVPRVVRSWQPVSRVQFPRLPRAYLLFGQMARQFIIFSLSLSLGTLAHRCDGHPVSLFPANEPLVFFCRLSFFLSSESINTRLVPESAGPQRLPPPQAKNMRLEIFFYAQTHANNPSAGSQILFRIPTARIPSHPIPSHTPVYHARRIPQTRRGGLIDTHQLRTLRCAGERLWWWCSAQPPIWESPSCCRCHRLRDWREKGKGRGKNEPAVPTEGCGPAAFFATTPPPLPLAMTGLLATLHLCALCGMTGIALCSPVRRRGLLHGGQVFEGGGGPFPWCRSCQHIALVLGTTSQDNLYLTVGMFGTCRFVCPFS